MNVMSTKEEWLYRLIIDSIRVNPRPNGEYMIDIMLTGVPKDKYDASLVLKVIGNVQTEASIIVDKIMETNPVIDNITKEVREKTKEHFFGKEN